MEYIPATNAMVVNGERVAEVTLSGVGAPPLVHIPEKMNPA